MNNDLISRSALLKAMGCEDATKYGNKTAEQQHNSYSTMMMYEIADYIDDAPAVDAEPVRHGFWTKHNECSECGELALYNGNEEHVRSRSCPNCGVKMDLED